jgi:excisionase family DNA binding protein
MPTDTLPETRPTPEWMTVYEVGAYLGICKPLAYKVVKSPGFPALRVGHALRIPRAQFLEWLEEQTGRRHAGGALHPG